MLSQWSPRRRSKRAFTTTTQNKLSCSSSSSIMVVWMMMTFLLVAGVVLSVEAYINAPPVIRESSTSSSTTPLPRTRIKTPTTDNYVGGSSSSSSGTRLPLEQQRRYLKDMTDGICSVEIGQLSRDQLLQAPELLRAWSSTSSRSGTLPRQTNLASSSSTLADRLECAMAVESIIKRLVDERRDGTNPFLATSSRSSTSSSNPIISRSSSSSLLGVVDVHHYNCLLEGWAKSGHGIAAAERCDEIVTMMQHYGPEPNLSSFKAVLMAWRQAMPPPSTSSSNNNNEFGGISRSHSSSTEDDDNNKSVIPSDYIPRRAQNILEYMIRLYTDGYNADVLPDSDCFDLVMQIWSRSEHVDAPKQVEHLLLDMERLYRLSGCTNNKLRPRTTSYNAILTAWCKSPSSQYNEYQSHGFERACEILDFMEHHEDTNIAPSTVSYNIVMGALSRISNRRRSGTDLWLVAKQASSYVERVEAAYLNNPNGRLRPNSLLFNTAIGCWAKVSGNGYTGAYRNARSLLDRQITIYEDELERNHGCVYGDDDDIVCKPDIYSYTSVIAACAAECSNDEQERLNAFHVALRTYKELLASDETPNHVTYGTMLKACSRLLRSPRLLKGSDDVDTIEEDEGRSTIKIMGELKNKWIRDIFTQCKDDGCVGHLVLHRLSQSKELYNELMMGYKPDMLPYEWTCNINNNNNRYGNQQQQQQQTSWMKKNNNKRSRGDNSNSNTRYHSRRWNSNRKRAEI